MKLQERNKCSLASSPEHRGVGVTRKLHLDIVSVVKMGNMEVGQKRRSPVTWCVVDKNPTSHPFYR